MGTRLLMVTKSSPRKLTYMSAYRAANREACRRSCRASYAAYAAAHPDELREQRRSYYLAHREEYRFKKLRDLYGMDVMSFEKMLDSQGHACAVCGTRRPGGHGWCVDHDHVSGIVRGILCPNCNTGIGHLGDDAERVEKALAYLRKPR